jgi:hypothetical protein
MVQARRLLAVTGLAAGATGGAWLTLVLCARPVGAVLDHRADGRAWSSLPFETLLEALAAAVLVPCALWAAAVTLGSLVEALTGASSVALDAVTPLAVRRVVLLCCGIAVGGASTLAPAAAVVRPVDATWSEPTTAGSRAGPELLAGLPLPDRVVGGPPHRPSAGTATHRVRPGDSLWAIAERLLRPRARPRDVHAGWRALYRANRDVVGADPDLILPGTTLRLPPLLVMPPQISGGGLSADPTPPPGPFRKDPS